MAELYTNFQWALDGSWQSMLVEGGNVVFRGEQVPDGLGGARVHDLQGRSLLPRFIDSHCHILPTGLDLMKLSLDGCTSHEEVLGRLQARLPLVDEGEWLMAIRYDQTRFPNAEHLNRHQLDSISSEIPILLRHVNGHASVANTACLERAGVSRATSDPKGGSFVRDPSGDLTGVLLERAHETVTSAAGSPNLEQAVQAILEAGDKMSALGIVCASDMMTGRYGLETELNAYRIAAERGCKIRTRLFVQWGAVFGPRAMPKERLAELSGALDGDRCRIGGIKIFADGAIGSATAGIYGRFTGSPQSDSKADGQLIYEPDRLKEMIRVAHDAGYRIAVHSIGDYSTDVVMDAYEAVGDSSRHRIEHAMLLSDAQIERMAKLGNVCSMQPEFLMLFGHAYRKQLGEERASKLNRFRSVLRAGIPLCLNSDRPIVGGDPWDGVRTAESRPEGFDPSENLTRPEALRAYTETAAFASGESSTPLSPGTPAEFQLI